MLFADFYVKELDRRNALIYIALQRFYLQNDLYAANTSVEKNAIEQLVYELYDLKENEIKRIEKP